MKHFVLLVLACLTFGMPRIALSESYEARKTQLNQARDAYHALMDQLPFNALRLDFASVGSAAFTAAEVEVVAMAPWQEKSRYLTPWQGFDLVALYDNPQAMADTYVGALMANYGEFLSSNQITVVPPFRYPFEHEIEVRAVSFGGDVVEIGQAGSTSDVGLYAGPSRWQSGVEVRYPDEKPIVGASHVEGIVKLLVPHTIQQYQFEDMAPGNIGFLPDFEVTLRQHSGGFVAFEIVRSDGVAIPRGNLRTYIQGVTADGKSAGVLRSDLSTVTDPLTHSTLAMDLLNQYLNGFITEQQARDRLRPLRYTSSDQIIFRAAFTEPVDSVTIWLLETDGTGSDAYRFSIPVIDYTVSSRNRGIHDMPIPMPTAVVDIDHHRLLRWAPQALTVDRISQSIDISTGPHGTTFRLPPTVSDLLFSFLNPRMSLARLPTFINATGDVITLPEAPSHRPNYDQPFSFYGDRLSLYPDRLSERPHRVIGEVEVAYLPKMLRERYSRDDLPSGVQIIDNMVITGGFLRRNTVRVLALDAEGRPLKRFFDRQVGGRGPFGLTVEYYYGLPSQVEVLQAGPIKRVRQAFDITLTEMTGSP